MDRPVLVGLCCISRCCGGGTSVLCQAVKIPIGGHKSIQLPFAGDRRRRATMARSQALQTWGFSPASLSPEYGQSYAGLATGGDATGGDASLIWIAGTRSPSTPSTPG